LNARGAAPNTSTSDTTADAGSAPQPASAGGGLMGMLRDTFLGKMGPRGGQHPGILDAAVRSAARSVGSQVGREIVRGVLGGILGRKR
ncbi:MAG TPA: helicase HerA-like domain-containing protein, partial [Burkholderiales bacterium]|nr:helicase HerA-like domain-containing protein [Burkholderiales bacterium]